ncbi:hypothetical protein CERSUDRAFT_106812 [Gelatoporia subvermispora B]|uniref:FAD/NAD(P)-binding domain-containing protein n=1 Tax=Ceriporiopsis subvermispora (strain B) TaxID=914234 RepID=M2QEI8_CERS8|nr:hypothetical protein CERSUDRAFT_106812 [Gelatoporia subvermispora B]
MDLPNPALDALISEESAEDVKLICVIGSGPGGLAALKVIVDSPQYKQGLWKPTAFEARDNIGGIWLPAPPTDSPPQTPLYDSLTTNLPHPIMAYPSFSFPPSTFLFPPAAVVQTYLEDYASHFDLMRHIYLQTSVVEVNWDATSSKWNVSTSNGDTSAFDLIIVANGHYHLPRYPETPGHDRWLEARKASHAAWYRHPDNFGETVLVVGAGPSGTDVSADMRAVARCVIQSVTGATPEDREGGAFKVRGRVAEFLDPAEGRVRFEDGTEESGIDYCILATGYQFNFPFFLPTLLRPEVFPSVPPLPRELYNSSYSVFPLARHVFPLVSTFPSTSLAFLGLPVRVAPFPLLEAQARAVLAAFADPERLDKTQEAISVVSRYELLRSKVGDDELAVAKAWHRFEDQQQFDYRDGLHKFAGGEFTGEEWMVPQWVRDMYKRKDVLRREWRLLESTGEAEDWVRGVGEGGEEEWIELMRELLRRADERDTPNGDLKTRL